MDVTSRPEEALELQDGPAEAEKQRREALGREVRVDGGPRFLTGSDGGVIP